MQRSPRKCDLSESLKILKKNLDFNGLWNLDASQYIYPLPGAKSLSGVWFTKIESPELSLQVSTSLLFIVLTHPVASQCRNLGYFTLLPYKVVTITILTLKIRKFKLGKVELWKVGNQQIQALSLGFPISKFYEHLTTIINSSLKQY